MVCLSLKLLNQFGHITILPICIDFFDGLRSCRDDSRYQDGLIKTSKIIVIKIRKTRERIARYSLTRLGSLSINAQNFGVNTCKFYKKNIIFCKNFKKTPNEKNKVTNLLDIEKPKPRILQFTNL